MFDKFMRKIIDPPLNHLGRWLNHRHVRANMLTLSGFAIGMTAAIAVIYQAFWIALVLIMLNRLFDGLDGAVARASRTSDIGGFLDITLDFFFYGSVPVAFAFLNPENNALPAAILLASFYMNGASFLSFAIMAEKHQLTTTARGLKSLYFIGGLAEGTETIIVFILFCLFPSWFGVIAYIFAGICLWTAINRVIIGWLTLSDR